MAEKIVSFVFDFEGSIVRTGGTAENPLFVAMDVCAILEVRNSRDALGRIPEDWKGVVSTDTLGGRQELGAVNEPGLYELIFASRKESAKRFRRWVFAEVLPSIRKTGKYELPAIPEQPKETIALPPADVRVANLVSALDRLGVDLNNPRFNQELQDFSLDLILGQKALPASQPEEWLGVVEKAERMGYSIALITSNRSQLGKYVASCNLASRKERRLCNGTMRDINLYLDCEALGNAIGEFLDAKILSTAL